MALNEQIVEETRYYRQCVDKDNKKWERYGLWNRGKDTECEDGNTVETKVGAIKGITTSTNVSETGYAADAKTVSEINQSLIPNYETTKTVLSDNSKVSYNKKYVVNKDSWFVCDHQSYNGYSWGNVFVNEIRVAGFRAMPIDEAHYAYSSTTFFAPKGSTIIINGAGGMTVTVSEIG